MHAEDGVSATVDHIHRTIYGALVGGRQPVRCLFCNGSGSQTWWLMAGGTARQ